MKLFFLILMSLNLFGFNDFYYIQEEPQQKKVKSKTIKFKGFKLTALYSYKIKARIVHAKRYSWDNLSSIITHDFGVTWGNISKTNIFNQFSWNQKDRFLIYSIREDYLKKLGGEEYVSEHIANIHLIPKDWIIEAALNKVKAYDIVEIEGYLVDLRYSNRIIYTSIKRDDKGPGACEVIFVKKFKIINSRSKNLFYYNKKERKINTDSMDFKNAGEGTRAKKYR